MGHIKLLSRRAGIVTAIVAGCMLHLTAGAATAKSSSVTDQLLAVLLTKHLPEPLYEQGSNPWPGGNYALEVEKAGPPEVSSSATNIRVKMPLTVLIAGNVGSELLQLKMACSARFSTIGEILLEPEKPGVVTSLSSSITLPIPPVMADCDGMQFPIEEYLRTVVAQNKKQWEIKLDTEIRSWLQGGGDSAKSVPVQGQSSPRQDKSLSKDKPLNNQKASPQ